MKNIYTRLLRPLVMIVIVLFLSHVATLNKIFVFSFFKTISVNISIYTILITNLWEFLEDKVSERVPTIHAYISIDDHDISKQDGRTKIFPDNPTKIYACIMCENYEEIKDCHFELFIKFPDFIDGTCGNNIMDDETRTLLLGEIDSHRAIMPISLMANDVDGNKDDFISIKIRKNGSKGKMKIFENNRFKISI